MRHGHSDGFSTVVLTGPMSHIHCRSRDIVRSRDATYAKMPEMVFYHWVFKQSGF